MKESEDNQSADNGKSVELDESLQKIHKQIDTLLMVQKKQGKYLMRKSKAMELDIAAIRADQQNYDKEIGIVKERVELRDKQISKMVAKLEGKENTNDDRNAKLWHFIGNSESLFEGLKESVNKANDSLDEVKEKMVTTDECKINRDNCIKKKKVWYEYFPYAVSALTLLGMIYAIFIWVSRIPIMDIDTLTAVKEYKLKKAFNTHNVKVIGK